MMKTEKRKLWIVGYYNYTVVLTYMSLLSAVTGIIFAAQHAVQAAVICLMISGICDMFDGTVARTRKRTEDEKAFGAHIDSLSDLVAFGVLPAMILYALGGDAVWNTIIMCLFVLAALIRLAYFDVQEMHKIDNGEKRLYFNGLPVTNTALILPGLLLFNLLFGFDMVVYYSICLVGVMLAFVIPFKLKKAYMPALLFWALLGVVIFTFVCIFGSGFDPVI